MPDEILPNARACPRCGGTTSVPFASSGAARDPLCAECSAGVGRYRVLRRVLLVALVSALLPYLAWAGCATRVLDEDVGGMAWLVAVGLALAGAVTAFTVGVILSTRREPAALAWLVTAIGITSPVITVVLGFIAPGFSYTRGRALRRRGVVRVPRARADARWGAAVGSVSEAPPEAAEGWRVNAATEAASVAAFAHLSTELLALGAPASLIEDAHADALDELRHARLCYALAERMDGRAAGPAPFPEATLPRDDRLDLASLAADCVIEACLYESASARVAAALAARADVSEGIRAVLEIIAVDEARHARHGYDVVEWCIAEGGPAILDAMRAAVDAVEPRAATGPGTADGLEPHGLAGPRLWREHVEAAHAEVLRYLDASRGAVEEPTADHRERTALQ